MLGKAKPLPLPLVNPASHPPPGFRAMLICRLKLKYPEMSESQIACVVGCSPSNVRQVLKQFLCVPSDSKPPLSSLIAGMRRKP